MNFNHRHMYLVTSRLCLLFVLQAFYAQAGRYFPDCVQDTGALEIKVPSSNCIYHCPGEIKTVCGTDSVPYHNACFLCRAACENPLLGKGCDGDCPCKDTPLKKDGSSTVRTTTTNRDGGGEKVITEEFDSDGNKIITTKRKGEPDKVVIEQSEKNKGKKGKKKPKLRKSGGKKKEAKRGKFKAKRSKDAWKPKKSKGNKKTKPSKDNAGEEAKRTKGPRDRWTKQQKKGKGRHFEL